MSQALDRALSPDPHYCEIKGRAAEIARVLGSPVGGAEHLFLGMLHDGGWPVNVISHLVDLSQAEAAVLGLLNSPGYSPPTPPRFLVRDGYVQTWGAEVAFDMDDSYIGVEHAFLAMIRMPQSIPARALAGLADLDALEAAVLAAKNAPPGGPPGDAVFLPEGQELDGPLRRAIADALPDGTTLEFSSDTGERTWVYVIGPGDSNGPGRTREVLNTALATLGRAAVDSQTARDAGMAAAGTPVKHPPAKLPPRLSFTVAVNGQSQVFPDNGPPPGFTVTPGEDLQINVDVTVPAHHEVTAMWLGISAGVIGPPSELHPILARTRKPLGPGPHRFRLHWTVPAGLQPGTLRYVAGAWDIQQAHTGGFIAGLIVHSP
jgi:hypothetical protein